MSAVEWNRYARCLECGVDEQLACRTPDDVDAKAPCPGRTAYVAKPAPVMIRGICFAFDDSPSSPLPTRVRDYEMELAPKVKAARAPLSKRCGHCGDDFVKVTSHYRACQKPDCVAWTKRKHSQMKQAHHARTRGAA
jgi:hypothetical protein